MKNVSIQSQRTVLQSNRFRVDEMELELGNGKVIKHENVYKNLSVSVFPITELGELYLIDEYRYLYEKTFLHEIAGFVEKGEEPLKTAQRELGEEGGLRASNWELLNSVEVGGSVVKATQMLYIAKGLETIKQNPEDDEDIKLVKLSIDEAVEKVIDGKIVMMSSIIGILMIDKLRQQGKL